MDDDEPKPATTAQRALHARKVPGSFDDDEISPAKEQFDDTADRVLPDARPTQLDPVNIPSLRAPSAHDSSVDDGPSLLLADSGVSDSFTEQVVRDHLQDVESSFAAPLSPLPTITKDGADDTFLFDSPKKASLPPAGEAVAPSQPQHDASDTTAPFPFSDDTHTPMTAAPAADLEAPGNATASLEAFSSSPTAAATARTVSKVFSDVRADPAEPLQDKETRIKEDAGTAQSSTDEEGHPQRLSLSGASLGLRQRLSDADFRRTSGDAGSTPAQVLRYGKRPKFLRSRDASQRSSVSSFASNPDSHEDVDSDVTVGIGADYALQSGGAVPALGVSRSMSNILSRSISMGSMLSGIEDFHDSSGRLATFDEDDNTTIRRPAESSDKHQQTPKAKSQLAPPTDTVIARRVMDVQVPDSLAKEYKSKGGFATPRRPSEFSMAGSQRTGRSLTLKEQSSTIERLSKENFDLKLKVMFLSDRLDKLSEEGVKEMIQENVEFRTNIAVLQRENKALRRRAKELEKQLKEDDERPSTARSAGSSNGPPADISDADAHEREEELMFLRERVEEYTAEIERLRRDNMNKEAEKRRMAEVMKSFQALGEKNAGESLGRQEEEDVWKDLLEQETARREQADEDNSKLRDELFRLKQELASAQGTLHHTTNIYNISKKQPGSLQSRPVSAFSGDPGVVVYGTSSGSSTLVDDLRRESEQLRHENAELRREVGAQTSMLTSRNREKERLYQEIEDLKLAQRRGGPAPSTIDSLLDRSASQMGAHERSASRMSGGTRAETALDDAEREELENKNAELRDKINEVKLDNQTLAQELEYHKSELEAALQAKLEAEDLVVTWQDEVEATM